VPGFRFPVPGESKEKGARIKQQEPGFRFQVSVKSKEQGSRIKDQGQVCEELTSLIIFHSERG